MGKRKAKPDGKTYEIDSFEKLCNVINADNFESITKDLVLWLHYHVRMMESIRKQDPKYCKGKTNWDITNTCFVWTNDGINDITHISVKNKLTGEVRKIEFGKSNKTS